MQKNRDKIYNLLDMLYISWMKQWWLIQYKSYLKADLKHTVYKVGQIIPCTQKAFVNFDAFDISARYALQDYLIDLKIDEYFVVDFNGTPLNNDYVYLCLALKKPYWKQIDELYVAFKIQGII